ncbi:hypothetical protein B8W90_13085, partial [Staphylococcus hominis]
ALASAEALGANGRQLDTARQAITQARQAERALTSPPAPNARGKREVVALLRRFDEAQARGDFLSPPGRSAYDALREAQA